MTYECKTCRTRFEETLDEGHVFCSGHNDQTVVHLKMEGAMWKGSCPACPRRIEVDPGDDGEMRVYSADGRLLCRF